MFRRFSDSPLRLPQGAPRPRTPGEPPIFGFNADRSALVRDTVVEATRAHRGSRRALEAIVADTAFEEVTRLERQRDDEARQKLAGHRSLLRRIARMSDAELLEALDRLATEMAGDVAGNFDPRVYELAIRAAPRLVTAVMQPTQLPKAVFSRDANQVLSSLLRVEGDVASLRRLERHATLVYVPTHSSNLDSVVLAQALQVSGLSPVLYGAGKNLFTNPALSFFMHNLGAYRVDRRIRANLYKDVLKSYARETVRRGYHGLFFPGGTRSRSNLVESKLKLGLAGAAVEAFAERRVVGDRRPIAFVPATINYALVLEAETLVDDWLTEAGKSRYLIDDDEFSQLDRWVDFFRKVVGLHSACVIRFGQPMDPFGNAVDDEGRSIGPAGQILDPGGYVERRGAPTVDRVRDAAYTRELGERIARAYARETVVLPTHLVSHVLYRHLVRETPTLDFFARLRLRNEVKVRHDALAAEVGETRDRLVELERAGRVHLSPELRTARAPALVETALLTFTGYHRRIAARGEGLDVVVDDPTLLLYYQNRLVAYARALAGPGDADAAATIARIGGRS